MEGQLLFRAENGDGVFQRVERFVVCLGVAFEGLAAFFGLGDVNRVGADIGFVERFGDDLEGAPLPADRQPAEAFAAHMLFQRFHDEGVGIAVKRQVFLHRVFKTGGFGGPEPGGIGPDDTAVTGADPAGRRHALGHLGEGAGSE